MTTSPRGRALIKKYEGLRLTAYEDAVGKLTIGYGHTGGVISGEVITGEQSEGFLSADIATAERCIQGRAWLKEKGLLSDIPLNQNQYDALISFIFNIGCGNFGKSTIFKRLLNEDYKGAAEAWIDPQLIWNKAGGVVLDGLTARRHAEHDLFVEAV